MINKKNIIVISTLIIILIITLIIIKNLIKDDTEEIIIENKSDNQIFKIDIQNIELYNELKEDMKIYCNAIVDRNIESCKDIKFNNRSKDCEVFIKIIKANDDNSIELCEEFKRSRNAYVTCRLPIEKTNSVCQSSTIENKEECEKFSNLLLSEEQIIGDSNDYNYSNFYFTKSWVKGNPELCKYVYNPNSVISLVDNYHDNNFLNIITCKAMHGINICNEIEK